MEKGFEKLRERRDEGREEASEGVKYPPHIKEKLDNALAKIVVAKDDEARIAAMNGYRTEMDSAKEQFELVEFGEERIHRFELEALAGIAKEIYEMKVKQGKDLMGQTKEDLLEFLRNLIDIKDNQVIKLHLYSIGLKSVPVSVNSLLYLKILNVNNNDIEKVENISELPNLELLSMVNNNIRELDANDFPKSLKHLDMKGCPVKDGAQFLKDICIRCSGIFIMH